MPTFKLLFNDEIERVSVEENDFDILTEDVEAIQRESVCYSFFIRFLSSRELQCIAITHFLLIVLGTALFIFAASQTPTIGIVCGAIGTVAIMSGFFGSQCFDCFRFFTQAIVSNDNDESLESDVNYKS